MPRVRVASPFSQQLQYTRVTARYILKYTVKVYILKYIYILSWGAIIEIENATISLIYSVTTTCKLASIQRREEKVGRKFAGFANPSRVITIR